MGGLFARIFGSDKVLEGAIDGVTKGLDALVYTDEERATDAAKERAEARAIVIDWMKNSQGQNIARRFLALIIAAVWLSMYLLSALMDASAPWVSDSATATKLVQSGLAIGSRAYEMNGAMMLILGFYFAAPHLGSIVEVAMQRFGAAKPPTQ